MAPSPDDSKFKSPLWLKRKLLLCEGAHWRCECCNRIDRPLDIFFFERSEAEPWNETLRNVAVLCLRCIEVEKALRPTVEKTVLENLRSLHFLAVDLLQTIGHVAAEWPSSISKNRADKFQETELLIQEALGQPEIADTVSAKKQLDAQIRAALEQMAPNQEIPEETNALASEATRLGRLIAAFVDNYVRKQRAK